MRESQYRCSRTITRNIRKDWSNRKDKLKNLMKNKLFIGCTASILVIAIITTVILCSTNKTDETPPPDSTSQTTTSEIDVPDISQPGSKNDSLTQN